MTVDPEPGRGSALDRVATVLHRARVVGGWVDEDVAAYVLYTLGLDEDGKPVDTVAAQAPTLSNLGHG